MRYLFSFLTTVIIIGCSNPSKKESKKYVSNFNESHFQHLNYLLSLKNTVATKHWNSFSDKELFSPIAYYTKKGTYILNPNNHIDSITDSEKIGLFNSKIPTLLLSEEYTDTLNFQFSSSYSNIDSTSLYFKENVLSFQSFELTQKFIPDIIDIQDWSIMVIHELFHSFQRSIPEHKEYYSNLLIPDGPDNFLGKYYQKHEWYKESIIKENDILKGIWIDDKTLVSNIIAFDSLRSIRINRIIKEYNIDIREIEDYEIMIEGQARYFESLCKRYLSNQILDNKMLDEEDLSLITNMYQQYDVKKDKGLYNIYNNRYYYQLGFNISMILEKHLPSYKNTIYYKQQNFNYFLEQLISQNNELK